MIVRLLFWIGLLPWLLALAMIVLVSLLGGFDAPENREMLGPIAFLVLMGVYWMGLCWIPALVYRFLFGRRRARDA